MAKKKKDDDGSGEASGPEKVPPGQRTRLIQRLMATYQFTPREDTSGPHLAEYVREVGDKSGRHARITVVFHRGQSGLEHAKLEGAYVAVMARVPPKMEALDELPPFAKQILTDIFSGILGLDEPTEAAVTEVCSSCGRETAEFYTDPRGKAKCIKCFRASMGSA